MLPQALFCTPSTALRQPEHRNEPAPCVCVRAHHILQTLRVCNAEFVSRALPSAAPPSSPMAFAACVRVAVHTQVPTNAPRCIPPTHDQRCHHRSAHSTQCSAFRPPNTTPFLMLWGMPQNSVRPQRPLHTLSHTRRTAPSNNPTPRLVRERPACAWLRGVGGLCGRGTVRSSPLPSARPMPETTTGRQCSRRRCSSRILHQHRTHANTMTGQRHNTVIGSQVQREGDC